MKKLNEEGIIIGDPTLANKYLLTQRSINDRLKKKAQLDKEIAVYKQQMAEIEKLAIKKQVATIKATEQTKEDPNQQQQQQNQSLDPALQTESLIPTFEEFKKDLFEVMANYEKIEGEMEKEADETLLFYLKIVTDPQAMVKVYKEGDIDDRWTMTVVEGDNSVLDEMEFDPDFSKMEIVTYLGDIYGEIEEVDEEYFDDVIDDKKELDDDFYEG